MKPAELPAKSDGRNVISEEKAIAQQEAIKKIMAEQRVPFEQAATIYIERKRLK